MNEYRSSNVDDTWLSNFYNSLPSEQKDKIKTQMEKIGNLKELFSSGSVLRESLKEKVGDIKNTLQNTRDTLIEQTREKLKECQDVCEILALAAPRHTYLC